MSKIDEPIISNYEDDEEEHTMISFIPDLMRFGMTELTDDVIALLSKRVYDIAETMKDTEVFLNDKLIIGLKRKTIYIEKLDDAVNAGTSLAQNCTLILTEGDSAKAFALSGLDVVSERNNWGVYPLREEIYTKLAPIEHVLKRPDTYVGSVEATTERQWIYNYQEDKLEHKEITYVPAFLRIFNEILVNAVDNKIRDPLMSTIKVKFDKESKLISVYNNGKGILIGIHKELNVYVPEMLFGQLMTSSDHSNGRNGLGAKFTNIFSTQFTVETTDATQKKKYIQSFYNNMSKIDEPIISNYDDDEEEHTMISFIPDLMRFGMTELTDDVIALLSKRVYDIAEAMKDTEVFLNDKQIIGLKRKTINVEKLDDAVNAGTSLAQNCTLILTEGDSAKAFALSGLDVVSERNNWGVYPLRGDIDELSESNLNIETNLQKGNKTTSNKERKRKLVDIDVETSEPSNQCGRKIKRTNFGI
ncbi:8580_t:CDS:2 [Entrophospora sp. SA101]|nr:8580_t:CDS:2 [Entrophospora sp. SA101]